MFTIDPGITHFPVRREQVVAVLESINQPVVAVPGKPSQISQAFVIGLRNPGGTYSLYVFLWLTQTRESVVYAPPQRHLALDQLEDAETEAAAFCESMGFLLDDLRFRDLDVKQQESVVRSRAPFVRDPVRIEIGTPTGTPAAGVPAAQPPTGEHAALPPRSGPAPASSLTPDQARVLARLLVAF